MRGKTIKELRVGDTAQFEKIGYEVCIKLDTLPQPETSPLFEGA